MSDSFFSDFDTAPVGYGRNFLDDGDYVLTVTEVKEIKASESKKGVHSFIGAFRVVSNAGTGSPAGFESSWVQTIPERVIASDPKAKERAMGTIKQFLACCLGQLDAFEGEGAPKASEIFQAAISPAQPLKGATIRAKVRTKVTKAGKDFSVHTFAPFEG